MKKIVAILTIALFFCVACTYNTKDDKFDKIENSNIEILEKIDADSFSCRKIVYVNKNNFAFFCELLNENPELIQNFLNLGGKLVVSPEEDMLQKIESKLQLPVQGETCNGENYEHRFVILCEENQIVSIRQVLVENSIGYKDEDIIRIAISQLNEEENWEPIITTIPEYVGSKGYVYIGKEWLILNVRQDIYTIQDNMEIDTYFAITNISIETAGNSIEMGCGLETTTSSMSYVDAEPQRIADKETQGIKLMAGLEAISWKQSFEGMYIDTKHMPHGKCWDIKHNNEKMNLKMGVIWSCPMEKEKVSFCSTMRIIMDNKEQVIQDEFSYEMCGE